MGVCLAGQDLELKKEGNKTGLAIQRSQRQTCYFKREPGICLLWSCQGFDSRVYFRRLQQDPRAGLWKWLCNWVSFHFSLPCYIMSNTKNRRSQIPSHLYFSCFQSRWRLTSPLNPCAIVLTFFEGFWWGGSAQHMLSSDFFLSGCFSGLLIFKHTRLKTNQGIRSKRRLIKAKILKTTIDPLDKAVCACLWEAHVT